MKLEEPRVEYIEIGTEMITQSSQDCQNEEAKGGSHCTGVPYVDQSCFDSAPLIC